jgi:hypothetical protein
VRARLSDETRLQDKTARLLDETAQPPLRRLIGDLMAASRDSAFAVRRIRLAALDLEEREVAGLERCRVLLGILDVDALRALAEGGPVARLRSWIASGRLEVRSAGIGAWTPDFSVHRRDGGSVALVGAHYFGSPHLTIGPSFTVVSEEPGAADVLGQRFDRLWETGHDVLPAIAEVLDRPDGAPVGVGG